MKNDTGDDPNSLALTFRPRVCPRRMPFLVLQSVVWRDICFQRTKSKIEQDQWFAALRDACRTTNLQTFVRHREHRKSSAAAATAESRRHNSRGRGHNNNNNGDGAAAAAAAASKDARSRQRYDRSLMESFDDVFFEVAKRNGFRNRAALRKAESDDRIAFYRELHGLVRTDAVTCDAAAAAAAATSDKEMSCSRSRSLSYESIYFKPQENYCGVPAAAQPPTAEPPPPYKSHSCRELAAAGHPSAEASASLFRARRRSHDSDDYAELIDIDGK